MAKTKTDAFAVKSSGSSTGKNPVIDAKCKEDIDAFVDLKEKIKALEGELTLHQANILVEAKATYAERALIGKDENIRLQGENSNVLYIVQDKSSAFSQDDFQAFSEKWGKKVAENLLQLDFSTFRINPEVMKDPAKAAKVKAGLAKLQDEIGESVLLPGSYKACEDAVKEAAKAVKSADKLEELIDDLKIVKFVRA